MATIDGGDDAKGTLFDLHPMAWFIIPASIFVASMVILVLLRHRRRRRAIRKAQWAASGLPTHRAQPYGGLGSRPQPQTTTTSWSQRARGFAGFKRTDGNGLNEYGEAPPAYTEPGSQPKPGRGSMSTSTSSVPQMRYYGGLSTNPAPMTSMSFPMPGGPPTFHPMTGAGGYQTPSSPTSQRHSSTVAGLSQPQAAVVR